MTKLRLKNTEAEYEMYEYYVKADGTVMFLVLNCETQTWHLVYADNYVPNE